VPGQERVPTSDRKGPQKFEPSVTGAEKFDRQAAALIYSAVGVFGPESWAAELSDMSGNVVDSGLASRMRQGAKSTPLRALLPLLRDPEAALVLLTAMARYAGLAPPTRVRKVTREEVEASTAQAVRRVSTLWKLLRREVADELGTDEDDVEAAFAAAVAK
jgi:hypothetical protein